MKKLITRLVATLALALVAFTPDIASAGRGHAWRGGYRVWLWISRLARLRLGLGRMVGPWRRHLDRRL